MSERRRHKDQDVEGSRRVCTCDDETPELTTRRIFAQFFRSFVTLDIWLCHFRVPRAVFEAEQGVDPIPCRHKGAGRVQQATLQYLHLDQDGNEPTL